MCGALKSGQKLDPFNLFWKVFETRKTIICKTLILYFFYAGKSLAAFRKRVLESSVIFYVQNFRNATFNIPLSKTEYTIYQYTI